MAMPIIAEDSEELVTVGRTTGVSSPGGGGVGNPCVTSEVLVKLKSSRTVSSSMFTAFVISTATTGSSAIMRISVVTSRHCSVTSSKVHSGDSSTFRASTEFTDADLS